MHKINLVADSKTAALIEEMKSELDAQTDIDVLRKSLALAKAAVDHADEDGYVVFRGINNVEGVSLNLRA